MDDGLYLPVDPALGLEQIHLACLKGDFETVVKLACQPDIIDAPTQPRNGVERGLRETPIKLAALMGHVDIVWFLVEQGAALTHDRILASTYTGDEGLAARRRNFFVRTVQIGREHPDAANTRKTIFDILSSPGRRSVVRAMRGPRSDLGFPDYKLAKQGRDIVVFAPVLRIRSDIPLDRSKTIGIITSKASSCDILMSAHSGFRAGGDRHAKCLDTNEWNYIALHHIAKLLKFHFPGSKHDNGAKPPEDIYRGRAHAGHVEVLLAAWYAIELTKKQGVNEYGGDNLSLEWCLDNLHTLKRATLREARSAVIMIDSQPCATCLKFINYLFQYTGLHFSVKGAVGIGPTLATKDERTGVRLDTFGDAFLEQDIDGAEGYEESAYLDTDVDAVLETPIARGVPGGIRDTIEGNGDREGDNTTIHAQAQAASEAFARISSFSPVGMDNVNIPMTTPAPEPTAPQRDAPITPLRPRMRWGVPETGSRSKRGDRFGNIPSRRPANSEELLAEYKKKTPVWTWPGYNSAEPSPGQYPHPHVGHPHAPHLASPPPLALPTGGTLMAGPNPNNDMNNGPTMNMDNGGGREYSGDREDPVIIDMINDQVSYSSPPSSSAVRESLAAFNARINGHFQGNPSVMGHEQGTFSYSSFQPMPNPARQKATNAGHDNNMVGNELQLQPQPHTHMNAVHFDAPMQFNPLEDEEGYIHISQPPPPHLVSQLSQALSQHPPPQQLSQQSQHPSEPVLLSQTGSRYYAAALLMDAQSPDPTPCPIPAPIQTPIPTPSQTLTPAATPVSIPTPRPRPDPPNFQQWRFEPQPRAQPEVVSKHFGGPRLRWYQQGGIAFAEEAGRG